MKEPSRKNPLPSVTYCHVGLRAATDSLRSAVSGWTMARTIIARQMSTRFAPSDSMTPEGCTWSRGSPLGTKWSIAAQ